MLLAVLCLWFARWGQCPDVFDMRCVCWLQYLPIGHQNQALSVEGGGGGSVLKEVTALNICWRRKFPQELG